MLQRLSPPSIKPDANSAAPSSGITDSTIAKSVALLFEVFAARYGNKWTRTYEDPLARKVWARDLSNEGLSEDDINRGLRVSRTEEWPPTVGEFISQCRATPAELGVPEPREAYIAACRGQWPHPIVFHVAGLVGRYEMRTRPEAQTWPPFEAHYKRALEDVRRGRVFTMPPPPPALPAPPPKTPEEVGHARAIFEETVRRMRQGRL